MTISIDNTAHDSEHRGGAERTAPEVERQELADTQMLCEHLALREVAVPAPESQPAVVGGAVDGLLGPHPRQIDAHKALCSEGADLRLGPAPVLGTDYSPA